MTYGQPPQSNYDPDAEFRRQLGKGALIGLPLALLLCVGLAAGCPTYNVWHQSQAGKAELARAQSNRLIAVQEAEAKLESASKLAAADTIRANGIAVSNHIIGQSLNQNPRYLTWLFYETLKETSNRVIYVPTEASLPITEARGTVVEKP